MKKKLVIVGDSSFAEIAYEYFTCDSSFEVVGFSVERNHRVRDDLFGLPVVDLESVENFFPPENHMAFVALTYKRLNRTRSRLFLLMKHKGYSLASYVSSRAFVWRNVKLGENVFIFEGNVIQAFSIIKDNVILWSGNHIGHHSTIHKNCFISSHVVLSGHCEVMENCMFGVNVSVGDGLKIAADNFLAQGSVVFKDTEMGMMYRGNPAVASSVTTKRFFKYED
ncbi:acetyltransferase [Polynucleobacter paneuropaeus]|nr:acetyltransferase [Polynucleobacter paneuropaeus]